MANTQDIRRRIKSIRNTSQITKALQMVAASKMRKAQNLALAGRPYASLMNRVLVSLQQRTDSKLHPLLQVREVKKELVVAISTDKGLAGPLNTNLFREVTKFEDAKTSYVVSGAKARQFIVRTRRELLADFPLKDAPAFADTKEISKFCVDKFLSGEVDKVSVLFTHFINTINQRPTVRVLSPISAFDLPQNSVADASAESNGDPLIGYTFEPAPEAVLDIMLPYYLPYQVYQMVLDARASEHSSRLLPMKSATDNA